MGVEARSPSLWSLVRNGESVHVLADGFTWAEGPVWIAGGRYLLFSDVPKNRIYRWSPGARTANVFLEPSGGTETQGFREPGSNGLKPGGPGRILMADQGHRAIALLDLRTKRKRLLVERFEGKRLNSPNDVVVGPDGAIWFSDPPYGLDGIDESPLKEQSANRVYRLSPDGKVTAAESELKFPNGIALSPDGRTLYVSNSDPTNAIILAWDVSPAGKPSRRRVFADMTALAAKGLPGLPDGMTVDERGNLWATGPGGVHVLTPQGRELGLISTGAAISNCTFGGPDGRTLFMTSTHALAALRTNVRGAPARLPRLAQVMQ
jgi:gluconolactonase